MNNDRKNNMGHEALILIGCVMLLAFICRLWPILILMLLAVFAAAIVLLLRPQTDTNDTKPESPQPKSNVKSPNEDDVVTLAYSVILRRITELVTNEYPNARWIWESPNARQQIFISSELYICLIAPANINGQRCSFTIFGLSELNTRVSDTMSLVSVIIKTLKIFRFKRNPRNKTMS